MRHLKRIIALVAMLAMSVACVGPVYAANGSNTPQASPTLTSYGVWLDPGDSKGELDVSFLVTATGWADSLGVPYFEIYRVIDGADNDELVEMVLGTTSNGLKSSGFSFTNTYTYTGVTSGEYYYAVIAVSARIGDTFDSRTLTTRAVQAP